jgi:hypothetical protein
MPGFFKAKGKPQKLSDISSKLPREMKDPKEFNKHRQENHYFKRQGSPEWLKMQAQRYHQSVTCNPVELYAMMQKRQEEKDE